MTRDTYEMFRPRERSRFGDNEIARQFPERGAAQSGHPFHDRGPPKGSDIDLVVMLHVDRPASVYVSSNGDIARAVWLPKSLIKLDLIGPPERKKNGKVVQPCRVTLPEWKAKQAGLI